MASKTSVKQYLKTYLSLIKKADSENLDKILDYIKEASVKDSTKLSYLNSVISLKKSDPKIIPKSIDDWVEYRDKMNIKHEKAKEGDNISESQRKVLDKVKWDDVIEVVSKLYEKRDQSSKNREDWILAHLMTKYPVRNDFAELRIVRTKDGLKEPGNLILVPKGKASGKITLKEYKTAKTHGDINIQLEDEITNEIRKLIQDDRKYLFESGKKQPYTSSNFSHRLNSLFKSKLGVPISSTLLRKLYLTSKYGKVVDEMEQDAQLLGHSTDTAKKFYIDNNPSNKEK